MGEIKQERCLGSEGWLDGGVYAWLCVCVCVFVWMYRSLWPCMMVLSDKRMGDGGGVMAPVRNRH